MKHYELIKNGCYFDYCYAPTIKIARKEFSYRYSGNYTIICTGNDWERINVRFYK